MSSFRHVLRTLCAPIAAVRAQLPSERKARRAIARRFAAAVTRKAPAPHAPGLWPWAQRSYSI